MSAGRSVNERLDAIEHRLDALERGSIWADPNLARTEQPSCSRCNVTFSASMGYVCPYDDCPVSTRGHS